MKSILCAVLVVIAAVSVARADQASHDAAAKKMLDTMDMQNTLESSIHQMLDLQIQQNPTIAPYKATLQSFLEKYMSWQSLEPDFIKLYSDKFSEDELNQITAFYSTPAGQKLVKSLPDLMAQGAQIGQAKVQQHIGELQQAIMQQAQQNSAGPATQPGK